MAKCRVILSPDDTLEPDSLQHVPGSGEFKRQSPRLHPEGNDSGETTGDLDDNSQEIIDSGEPFLDTGEPNKTLHEDPVAATSSQPEESQSANKHFKDKLNQIMQRRNLSRKKAQQRMKHRNIRKYA